MKEKLIEFETAKLAKEKGFDYPTSYRYGYLDDEKYLNYWGGSEDIEDFHQNKKCAGISAPTQSLLQKWLRDEHKINIDILRTVKHVSALEKTISYCVYVQESNEEVADEPIYEQALEQGLINALKLIK